MNRNLIVCLTLVLAWQCSLVSGQNTRPRACRSVHLAFKAPEGTAFYNEVVVEKSAEGTYFMACGFSKGYFGIQQLRGGKKVVLFSVWEPGKQNNPNLTPEERRVKVIQSGADVRVKRFGGEGTGGQSFYDYQWEIGERCRFVVYAKPDGERTEYAGYFYIAAENRWQHLATFSTLADGHLLRGYYSFIEDFRRNGESATHSRIAKFANGWANIENKWQPLTTARFTADRTPVENIDAGHSYNQFFLATGGETVNDGVKLNSRFELPETERKPPLDLPQPFGDGAVNKQQLRILVYNIKHGRGMDGRVDLDRTASVIRRLNPDMVALQEVDVKVKRSGQVDEPKFLSDASGLQHNSFGAFFDYQGGEYGMAILSRYPILTTENLRLPDGAEPRTSLVTKIAINSEENILLANVHFYMTEQQRMAQATTLLDFLNKQPGNVVITGDFNSRPETPVLKLFDRDWINPSKGTDRFTFSSEKPDHEIDYALMRKDSEWVITGINVIHEPVASDHRPLVVELSKKPQK